MTRARWVALWATSRKLAPLALSLACSGCVAAPRAAVVSAVHAQDTRGALRAYEDLRESDGSDTELLRAVAALVLRQAAEHPERAVRRAALAQLQQARELGRDVLTELARDAALASVRAEALGALVALGDASRADELRALLDHADNEVRATAVAALDPADRGDRDALLTLLADPGEAVRRAAAVALREASPDTAVQAGLAERARVDPSSHVRIAALGALARQGEAAFSALRGRLQDADASVRMSALSALMRADPVRGAAVLRSYLATPFGRESVEAARLLAQASQARAGDGFVDREALHFLAGALRAPDENQRAQAAVAFSGLTQLFARDPQSAHELTLLERLRDEEVRRTRLMIALALLRSPRSEGAARAVLRALMEGEDMPALMAAVALSRLAPREPQEDTQEAAHDYLRASLNDARPTHRRVAAPALARDAGDPDAARRALADEDPWVRVAAAGALLR